MLDDQNPVAAYDSAQPDLPRDRPQQPRPPALTITRLIPCEGRGSLKCHVHVYIPSDYVTIYWVAVHQLGGDCSVRLPYPTAERRASYFAIPLRYADPLGARAFERAVVAAVRADFPDVLDGEGKK